MPEIKIAESHSAMVGMAAAGVGAVANRKIVLPSITGNALFDGAIDVGAGLAVGWGGTHLNGMAGVAVSGVGLGWAVSAVLNLFGI